MEPPRLGKWLLHAMLPEAERTFVLGDMDEGFARRAERDGRWRAVGWYWVEVTRSAWPLMTFPGRWGGMTMVGLTNDLRGAFRLFRSQPGFAAVIVSTLGVAVGAVAAVYSVVQAVVLTPLPFEDSDRVVMLWGSTPEYARTPLTVGDHNVLAHDVGAFETVAAAWSNNALILGEGEAEQVSVGWVTPGYFAMLRVRPELGRDLAPEDERAVLMSHDLWVRRYGADPGIVGRTIELTDGLFEVAGVLPSGHDPNLTTFSGARASHELWRLQPADWTRGDDRSVGWLRSTARLQDGVTLAQAQDEVDALMRRVNQTVESRDGGTDLRIGLVPVRNDLVGSTARTLWVLLLAVGGVLLIAASNVAHLMLARGESRAQEIAVRTALGGSRSRLMRQLLVEGAVLAGGAAALGVVLSRVGLHTLLAFAPASLPRIDEAKIDGGVLLVALGVTLLSALVFALVPAMRASRSDVSQALGERQTTAGRGRQRLSRSLIVAEVALSLTLLTSTGLLLRSLAGLERVDLGFQPDGVVSFALEAPDWGDSAEAASSAMRAYLDHLTDVPGVIDVAFTNRVPLAGGLFTGAVRSADMVAAEADGFNVSIRYVTPTYPDVIGARLLAGRDFRSDDGADVVLVDALLAERLWPGEESIGKRLEMTSVGDEPSGAEVIGVLAPMKHSGVADAAAETVFTPMLARAHQQNFRYAVVRVEGDPAGYVEPLRRAARAVDADAVLARVRTLRELVDTDVASTRFAGLLLAAFGLVALALALVGLHGVMAYSVRQRTREIGIRVALGAEQRRIIADTVRSGAVLVLGGIVLGCVLSIGAGRTLSALLFEVEPYDPTTLAFSSILLWATGMIGAWLPARLVLGVDPAVTLRQE